MNVDIRVGDCLDLLRAMPAESVQTCVTSPPYFGLRDYGTGSWEGGDPDCQHSVGGQVADSKAPGAIVAGVRPGVDASRCRKCGATRVDRQIGLEPTPDAFVAKLVEVFREVRRVLRDDGTLWLNLGDSYFGSTMTGGNAGINASGGADGFKQQRQFKRPKAEPSALGIKPKDLIGIPWRVAFALQADGWWLRQDIIWNKPNPMPESVTDRCTKAHEYLFLLSKGPRYYFDAEAIKEPVAEASVARLAQDVAGQIGSSRVPGKTNGTMKAVGDAESRNKRSVWTVTTKPFAGAHFATFPEDLILPCILAGAPVGGVVLDPFGGAGTTGLVAAKHQRRAILCELNPAYAALARGRIAAEAGLFAWSEAAE